MNIRISSKDGIHSSFNKIATSDRLFFGPLLKEALNKSTFTK
jgi:hypothetical protein